MILRAHALTQPVEVGGVGRQGRLVAGLVEQERAQLERQLLERQVVLADLELFMEGVDALGRRVRAMRAQLGDVNLPLLAQGLNEEAATGRLLQQEGEPDVIIMNGPGPVERAVAAVEQAALRAMADG